MEGRLQQTVIRSLSDKVRRRTCPRCKRGLQHAIVEVTIPDKEKARVAFTCAYCGFQSGGTVPLSARIKRELLDGYAPGPITFEEIDLVRNILANWRRPLTEFFITAE